MTRLMPELREARDDHVRPPRLQGCSLQRMLTRQPDIVSITIPDNSRKYMLIMSKQIRRHSVLNTSRCETDRLTGQACGQSSFR